MKLIVALVFCMVQFSALEGQTFYGAPIRSNGQLGPAATNLWKWIVPSNHIAITYTTNGEPIIGVFGVEDGATNLLYLTNATAGSSITMSISDGGLFNFVGFSSTFGSELISFYVDLIADPGSVIFGDSVPDFPGGFKAESTVLLNLSLITNVPCLLGLDSTHAVISITNPPAFNSKIQSSSMVTSNLASNPFVAYTNVAYTTSNNFIISGKFWTNTSGFKCQVYINFTLTDSSISGDPSLCMTNISTGDYYNATNSFTSLTVLLSQRVGFTFSPGDYFIATNKSSGSASTTIDASFLYR